MTATDFRRIALSFDGAEQGSHMGAVDFRVDKNAVTRSRRHARPPRRPR